MTVGSDVVVDGWKTGTKGVRTDLDSLKVWRHRGKVERGMGMFSSLPLRMLITTWLPNI